MLASLIGWALLEVSGTLFVTAMAAYAHPPWFRDPKTGVIPPRLNALLSAWMAPSFPAAVGRRFSFER